MAKHRDPKGQAGDAGQSKGKRRGEHPMIKDNPYKAAEVNRRVQAVNDSAVARLIKKMRGGK